MFQLPQIYLFILFNIKNKRESFLLQEMAYGSSLIPMASLVAKDEVGEFLKENEDSN
jgi:hypothetical protein